MSEPVVVPAATISTLLPAGDVPFEVNNSHGKADPKKRLSVERIYQKKTQLEHILLRPDSYIGSTVKTTQPMWVLDEEQQCMVNRDVTFSPGLYKIFDEILVNAADNKVRDPSMSCIKVDIDPSQNMIRIWNNGKGIPVVNHKVENVFVPTLIFGHLLTSSNYDDSERKVTGGRNGYGAKLCNIFSTKFIVETSSKEYKKSFRQVWIDNMTKTSDPKISIDKDEDFTSITFYPDLQRFGMTELEADTVALFRRRAYDMAATTNGVKVFLNGKRLPIKSFADYVDLYIKTNKEDDSQIKVVYETANPRWQIAVAPSNSGFQQASKCGIVESVLSWVRFKAMEKMDKQCHKSKHVRLKGIPKLDDANNAGTKNSSSCTLILTEENSANHWHMLVVVGRDNYGVFPLRGKLLNVREASSKQIMENAEINALIKILGLQYKNKYESPDSLRDLRYGKIMIMTDQDQDGSHIKGLIINFVHSNWPNLLRHNIVEEFITPIVKVFKGSRELPFYSLPEFEEWQKSTPNWHTWRIKYYKGLGTSSSKEAKEYFSDMIRHRIRFRYTGHEDDVSIQLAFDKSKISDRKNWLTEWTADRKRRRELGLPEPYLYGKDTRAISFHDFVHKELVLFSNLDNERSIPSIVDGLKPGQRKFGTRLCGGKDAASARYIFTALNPVTRLIFHPADDPILTYLRDDNLRIEPEWYCPIIPMILVNGADGIGTGYATRIPNYDVLEELESNRYLVHGEIAIIDDTTLEITELPVRVWTQTYKENVLEIMLNGTDKVQPCITYEKRKSYLEGMLAAEARKLENQARFVVEKIDGVMIIENKPRKELVRILQDARYDSDPVRAWKDCLDKLASIEEEIESGATGEAGSDESEGGGPDYNYILNMPLWSLSKERKDHLLAERDAKQAELRALRLKSATMLWREDLQNLEEAYKKFEADSAAEDRKLAQKMEERAGKAAGSGRGAVAKATKRSRETMPDPMARRGIGALDASFDAEVDEDTQDGEFDGQPRPLLQRLASGGTNAQALALAGASAPVGRGRGRGRGTGHAVVRKPGEPGVSPPKKRQPKAGGKRKPGRARGSDSDSNASLSVSDSSDAFEARITTDSPVRERIHRAKSANVKYKFDDSDDEDGENSASDENVESFKIVDHGQGSKDLDLPLAPPVPPPVPGVPSATQSSQHESTQSRSRGRGRGGGGGRGGRGRATAPSVLKNQPKLNFSEAPKKASKPQRTTFDISEDEEDKVSLPSEDGAPPASRSPRMNARRAATNKARYVFDLESSEGSDADNSEPAVRAPVIGKRKPRTSDDDDDFDPQALGQKKCVSASVLLQSVIFPCFANF
ncbi:DNA topoisomerase 2 [Fasciola gigantica]|uniref:DNA topoisomerase (ATP-hydrolyzing) n=1 Tax=Fasciola gigantica TaxID=46835 RepID=A0A504Z237_FASGI|nr:DNA topoisomerase 2 [Fasciola gigantica]